MQLKSYFSGTAEAAMELARRKLGPEALLVNVRPAARYLWTYGVVHSPLTPEVLKSPKHSRATNGRDREFGSMPTRLKPLRKSSLFEQRAAA
jgi:flagellar biosynthesis GTPase FlhF